MTLSTCIFDISSVFFDLVGCFVTQEKCLNATMNSRRFIFCPTEHFEFHAKLLCNPLIPKDKKTINLKHNKKRKIMHICYTLDPQISFSNPL